MSAKIKNLKLKLDQAWQKYHDKMGAFDFANSNSWQEMEDWVEAETEMLAVAGQAYSSSKKIEWKEFPTYGHKMTKELWLENVKDGMFIDYDGSGNYASDTQMSNISVSPSDLERGWIRKDKEFTHIIWFNR